MSKNHSRKTPILFSGHNERAIYTLCRFFQDSSCDFRIAASIDDAIHRTSWGRNIIIERESKELNLDIFQAIANNLYVEEKVPCFVPTSEFLIHFVYKNLDDLKNLGWEIKMPTQELYASISNKSTSPSIAKELINLDCPKVVDMKEVQSPCILKPNANITNNKVRYPVLCMSNAELYDALNTIDANDWFAQEWIEGQSIYLCAYIDIIGNWDAYWQENLLQQAKGKSIVLACITSNPGINVSLLMNGLHNLGYYGPFMMEVMKKRSKLYFIEINPRFWGPLELSRKACPGLLNRFRSCLLKEESRPSQELDPNNSINNWYAWAYGASVSKLRMYPSFEEKILPNTLNRHLMEHDIYNACDTYGLHGIH